MVYRKEYTKVNRAAREIWHSKLVSNRYIKDISEAEYMDLQSKGDVQIYVNSTNDDLVIADGETLERVPGHIAKPGGDQDYDDFEDGYYFSAELWKGEAGRSVIVLIYTH